MKKAGKWIVGVGLVVVIGVGANYKISNDH